MAKKKKGKGFFSAIGSALGSIPVVAKVKKATKTVKKQIKTAKKKVEKTVKKVKKTVKKKVGKVYTKARKIKNNLSKSKIVKKVKKTAKKAVLVTKKAVKKAKTVVTKTKQNVKATIKDTKKLMTKVGGKVAVAYKSFKDGGYKEIISAGLDFIPVVGNAKALVEAAIGRDPITGRKLESWERGASVAAILGGPLVKGVKHSVKLGAKAVSGATSGSKATNKTVNLAKSPTPKNTTKQQAPSLAKKEASATTASPAKTKVQDRDSSGASGVKPFVDNGQQFTNGRKNKLKPDVRYKTGEYDYFYETDNLGRISKFETDNLQLTKRDQRLPHSKNTPGKVKGQDHAGHLVGDRFGGSPKIDNLVSQLSDVNLKQYKKIEEKWAAALKEKPPKKVTVDIEILYSGDNMRPDKFKVKYTIDGKRKTEVLEN